MFKAVGRDVPSPANWSPGAHTVNYPNGPRDRVTAGDAALMDISQRVDGYWSDCTNTHVIGGVPATPEQRRYAKAAQDACEAAMAALKPGACDALRRGRGRAPVPRIDQRPLRGPSDRRGGQRTARLVPYDTSVIEAGMVFSGPRRLPGTGGHLRRRRRRWSWSPRSGGDSLHLRLGWHDDDGTSSTLSGKVAVVTGAAPTAASAMPSPWGWRPTARTMCSSPTSTTRRDRHHAEIRHWAAGPSGCTVTLRTRPRWRRSSPPPMTTSAAPTAFWSTCRTTSQPCPSPQLTLEAWHATLAVCLTGYFLCARQALQRMVRQGNGAIVNIGSIAGVSALGRGNFPTAWPRPA
ncbi:MAG: SDR family NAD(P)-dependent oxidoreductase [Caldilineaceae bacterium]